MDCTINYTPNFVDESDDVFDRLMEDLPLQAHEVTIFGKKHFQLRQVCWHGPGDYAYSGLALTPEPWSKDLIEIRDKLVQETKIEFNSVLVNHYADGSQSVGWHADDETYFGDDPTIATVSLGAPRLFCMKRKSSAGKTEKFILAGGSLFIMGAGVQQNWLHSVPKTKLSVGPRISLTYRLWQQP